MKLFPRIFSPAILLAPILFLSPPADQSAFVRVDVGMGHGSGTHLGNGYILTAAHVAHAAEGAMVSTQDGQVSPASLIWSDEKLDVAILKVSRPLHVRSIPVECETPEVGSEIKAYGNPLDQGASVSAGHIARGAAPSEEWESAILADMTAAPGMSGGGVIHNGKLIGILVGGMVANGNIVGFTFIVPTSAFCPKLKESIRKEGA